MEECAIIVELSGGRVNPRRTNQAINIVRADYPDARIAVFGKGRMAKNGNADIFEKFVGRTSNNNLLIENGITRFIRVDVVSTVRSGTTVFVDKSRSHDREVGKCDVLSVFASFKSWADSRGTRTQEFLKSHGVSHDWTHNTTLEDLRKHIDISGCKLLINEVCVVPPVVISQLAKIYPDLKILNMNHASPSFSSPYNSAMREKFEAMDYYSMAYPNVYSGDVMDGRYNRPISKNLSLPNIITIDKKPFMREKDGIISLSLIARMDFVKNFCSQVMAVCEIARTRPVSLILMTNETKAIKYAITKLNVDNVMFKIVKWADWEVYTNLVNLYVDIGLQASLSESFNLVGIEHLALGKPVIGSEALEYLPEKWKANPQDPRDIANKVLNVYDNLEGESKWATIIAEEVRKRNNDEHIRVIRELLK